MASEREWFHVHGYDCEDDECEECYPTLDDVLQGHLLDDGVLDLVPGWEFTAGPA